MKVLNVKEFEWEKNDLCKRFKECRTTESFVSIFKEAMESPGQPSSLQGNDYQPSNKRRRIDHMVPASYSARCSLQQENNETNESDTSKMDELIQCNFQGIVIIIILRS